MISIEPKTISITIVSLGERGKVQIGTIWKKVNGLDHYYHDPFIVSTKDIFPMMNSS